MRGRTGALLVDALQARLVTPACVAPAVGALLLPPRGAAGVAGGERVGDEAHAPGEPVVWAAP